jgi:hypothetical protein
MIRHNYKFAHHNFLPNFGGFYPFLFHNFANVVQYHFFINNGTEYIFPVMGADGDEVCPFLGVVVALKAVGVATEGVVL